MCNIENKIYTEKPKTEKCPVNKAAVHACQAIDIGYTQLSELMAFLEIPTVSETSYLKIQGVAATVHDTAWDEMKRMDEEEKKIALECGEVDVNGIPIITIVADGQWSKRSYRTKYDALSGAATIIGFKTKKILFIGILNKYCTYAKDRKIVIKTLFFNINVFLIGINLQLVWKRMVYSKALAKAWAEV
ncbi:hypothetical protein QTP88_006818 [Uroleucon formosanum]